MRKFIWALLLSCASVVAAPNPKPVGVIIIDQSRYDYLTRFRTDYKGGLDRLLDRLF